MHKSLPSEGERRAAKAEAESIEFLSVAWGDAPTTSCRAYSYLRDNLISGMGVSVSTAKRRIQAMIDADLIDRATGVQDGYILTEKGGQSL